MTTTTAFPASETKRLMALLSYRILDTPPNPNIDALVRLAAEICQTPIVLVSLIDEKRQWFKACFGLDIHEMAREISFCTHALLQADPLIVTDASLDARFQYHPLVCGKPFIRFYAGFQLYTSDGYCLGTLCVIDQQPRELTPSQHSSLKILANQVMQLFQLERDQNIESNQNMNANRFMAMVAHDLRGPISAIQGAKWMLDEKQASRTPLESRLMGVLENACQDAHTLIDELLEVAEVTEQRHRPSLSDFKVCSLEERVQEGLAEFETLAKAKGLELFWLNRAGQVQVALNPELFQLAFEKILKHTLKSTPAKGQIRVELELFGAATALSIFDMGNGIPTEIQSSLFDVVVPRPGNSGRRLGGLGLYIAREIVRLHGGQIVVSSDIEKGSCFRIELPLA